jgi:MFS family permease
MPHCSAAPVRHNAYRTSPQTLTADLGYGVAQIPLAWAIQRFPIGKALSTCIILWGAMVMFLGACNNYAQLVAVRVLLGIFESVVIPGFILLVSSWYLREEQTLRQCFYYSMSAYPRGTS